MHLPHVYLHYFHKSVLAQSDSFEELIYFSACHHYDDRLIYINIDAYVALLLDLFGVLARLAYKQAAKLEKFAVLRDYEHRA